MLKLSFSTLGCPDWPLRKIVESAAQLGYHAVDFRGLLGDLDVTGRPEFTRDRAATLRLFRDAGVAVSGFAASTRCAVADPAEWTRQYDEALRNLELARAFGAEAVRVFGGVPPAGHTVATIRPLVVEHLRALGEAAAGFGVWIAWETHDAWTNYELFADMMREVNHPNVRALWDMCNAYFDNREPPEAAHERLAPYVVGVHVKDAVRNPAGQLEYRMPGEGVAPVRQMLERLARDGFRGYAIFEWEKRWHPELAPPEIALPRYVAILREWGLALPRAATENPPCRPF